MEFDTYNKFPKSNLGFKTYSVSNRFFNLLLGLDDLQGDGFLHFTVVALNQGFQVYYWFNNKRHWKFDYRLFKPQLES